MITPIDPDTPGFIWHAVVRQVLTLIDSGDLAPGSRLPSIPDAAREFGVATKTIQRAYGWLGDAGVVASYFGRGTFVVARLPVPMPDPPDGQPL